MHCCWVYLFILSAVYAKSLPEDTPSGYAKVSNFGVKTPSGVNEARSSGLSLYSQSSNAKVTSGQNLRSKITYYNPTSSRVGEGHDEDLPGKGEVQERYNPRPYFQYLNVASSSNDQKSEQKPAVVYGSPFKPAASPPVPTNIDSSPPDSIPDSNLDSNLDSNPDSNPNSNPVSYNVGPPSPGSSPSLYDSPYDSYNPSKPSNPDDLDSQKPPGNLYQSPYDSYNPKPSDDKPSDTPQYLPPNNPSPPLPSPSSMKNEYPGYPYAPQELDHPPKDAEMYQPPQKPMEVDSYMPQDVKPSHDFSGYSDQGPQIVATVNPPEAVHGHYQEYSPPATSFDHHHHEHTVDSPPAPYNFPAKVPEYLDHDPKDHHFQYHDHDYHDHQVYHEVTTTTEMPEERVNKGHYSYYYLGRKLWYIPLYFSAYFILYITVLILKSIARHKVNFIHDLHDLGKGRSGRDMKIDEITKNVTNAVTNATQKYM